MVGSESFSVAVLIWYVIDTLQGVPEPAPRVIGLLFVKKIEQNRKNTNVYIIQFMIDYSSFRCQII